MKISQLPGVFEFLGRVSDKGSAGNQSGGQRGRKDQSKDQNASGDGAEEVSFEAEANQVKAAIETFEQDPGALANGLHASSQGSGPGLRVVLKDGTGAVVRQFTGEEFLKLRDAVNQGGQRRGKILDQKL